MSEAQLQRLVNATQKTAAATIAAALIAAAGRPHSVDEAAALLRDVEYTLYPQTNLGVYQAWEKSKKTGQRHG
jgi:hypothetical protein